MVLRDVIKGTTQSYHVHTRTVEDIEMVNRCVATDSSNTHRDRVSLFKLRDRGGKNKSSESERNGKPQISRSFVATILPRTALKWTVRLLHSSG